MNPPAVPIENDITPSDSRYKASVLYVDPTTRLRFYGLVGVIPEFTDLGTDYRTHRVAAPEVGFLDIVAVTYYGPGSELLWWVLAFANAIRDPERDMFAGQLLRIPTREAVSRFLSRGTV